MPVKLCRRALSALGHSYEEVWRRFRRSTVGKAIEPALRENAKWMEGLGPAGAELAAQTRDVALAHQQLRGRALDRLYETVKGSSSKVREEAAKVADGLLTKSQASPEGWALGNALKDRVLDPLMNMAQLFPDSYRRMADGSKLPIRGSGRAFPTVPNAEGWKFIQEAAQANPTPRVIGWAQKMVNQGKAKSVDEALAELRHRQQAKMRGTYAYFERTRTELPPEYREWDPIKALPDWMDRHTLFLEAARRWGWEMPQLDALIARIGAETNPQTANIISGYFQGELGRPVGPLPEVRNLHGKLRAYLRVRIFGGTFLGPARNAFQWLVNGVDAPISTMVRTVADYPPIIANFTRTGEQLRREVLRAGAQPGEHPFTSLFDDPRGPLHEWANRVTIMQRLSVQGSNDRAAILGMYALESNVARLIELQGNRGPLLKAWHALTDLSIDPLGKAERAITRAGIADSAALIQRIQSGGRLSLDEVQKAMALASYSTQFGYTLATKPVLTHQNALYNTLFFLKQWGLRQAEFIHENVLKELALGNAAPLVKLLGASFLLGEAYNIARDNLVGAERSLTMNALMNPNNNGLQATSFRVLRNIADGGGLAMIQDVLWGFSQYVTGPAGGTISNIARGIQYISSAPAGAKGETAGRAIVDLMDRELVASKQWLGLFEHAMGVATRRYPRFFEVNRVRQRAFEWLDQQTIRTEGWMPYFESQALDVIRGRRPREPGEFTLAYESMANALSRNDLDAAELAVVEILRTFDERREQNDVLDRFELAAQARSPLGPLTQDQRREYLRSLDARERRATSAVQDQWEDDTREILRRARREVR